MNKSSIHRIMLALFTVSQCVTACKVTEPYHSPSGMADNKLYRDATTADTTTIADVPWDQMFGDTLLRSLIAEGVNNNSDIRIAMARIKQAEANFAQTKASFFPALSANAGTTFQKLYNTQLGRSTNFEAYLSSGWEADLWGKLRSAKRAALASLLQSDAYKRAVQTQLVSDIAMNYYSLMAYDEQLQVTLQTVENRKKDVETMKALKESDVVTGAAVVQSEANRYSAEVTIPDLKQNIRETENSISVLLGRNPGSITRDSLENETVATDLKTGIASQLLANRPDVQEAEYQLRNSFELVNVAKIYFYPSFTITAEGGLSNGNISQFFNAASIFGNIIGGLIQPVFNNGLNKQRLHVAQARQEEYLVTFKQTLLTAGEEVSNALYQYQATADKIAIRSQQISFLQKSVDYTKELLKYTANTNYTDVLTSEQSLLAAELNNIGDKLQQLQAVVAIYRSLGGGWK